MDGDANDDDSGWCVGFVALDPDTIDEGVVAEKAATAARRDDWSSRSRRGMQMLRIRSAVDNDLAGGIAMC